MVANASNYRPPLGPLFFDTDPAKAIKLLRRTIQLGVEVVFLTRGQDKAFCEHVTEEALLRIHDDIDAYCQRLDFGIWAMAIAVRFGFSALRKQNAAEHRKPQLEVARARHYHDHSRGRDDQPSAPSSSAKTTKSLPTTHRIMVQRLMAGENPVAVAFDMNLDHDFTDIFLDEAVRKLNRLNDQLINASCQAAHR